MKINQEIAYTIIAKVFYTCRYCELKPKQQKKVREWCEDYKEVLYEFWKRGHRVWRKQSIPKPIPSQYKQSEELIYDIAKLADKLYPVITELGDNLVIDGEHCKITISSSK